MRPRLFCIGSILAILLVSPVNAQPTAAQSAPSDRDEAEAVNESYTKRQELIKALAEKHGYKLAEDESLKYIKDPQNEERTEVYSSMMSDVSIGEWMSGEREQNYEPFMLLFQADVAGLPQLASAHNGVVTLAEVLEDVLHLKRHQFECPPGLLMTYMPGDWVLSWDPRGDHELSKAELAQFEKILNESLDLGVRCEWKTVELPAVVVSGKYTAMPKGKEPMTEEVAKRADGLFEIPARRSNISASVGTYEKFLQAIGEVLMLPIVDEADVRPAKESFFWRYTGEPVSGDNRLRSEVEEAVLKSLAEQTGYELRVEPREVKLLSIQPVE